MAGDKKAKDGDAAADAPKGGKKKLIIIIAAVVLIAGGAGGWFFMKSRAADPEHAAEEHAKKEKVSRVFLPMDPFTVNLSGENNRFAQVAIVYDVKNAETMELIKGIMPAVRDRVLRLISSKQATTLLSSNGKEALAQEILEETAKLIGWEPEDEEPVKKKKPAAKAKKDDEEEPEDEEAAAEDEEDDAKAKKAASKASAKKSKAKPKKHAKPNPINEVHFAQFIIQ